MDQLNKIFIIILLYAIQIFGQFEVPSSSIIVTVPNINIGTVEQGDTVHNSLSISVNRKYVRVDSVAINNTVVANNDTVAKGAWVQNGNMTVTDDTVFSNIPEELNPNPTFSEWLYVDLLSDWDFTSGWVVSNATIDDNNSFSTSAFGGFGIIRTSSATFEIGSVYQIVYNRLTTSPQSSINFCSYPLTDRTAISTTSGTTIAVADNQYLYLRHSDAGTTDVTELSIKKLIAPTGWTASTMNATNYVVQDVNGLKFVTDGSNLVLQSGNIFVVGKKYHYKISLITNSAYGLKFSDVVSTPIIFASSGTYEGDFTAVGTYMYINRVFAVAGTSYISYLSITEVFDESSAQISIPTEQNRFYTVPISYKKDSLDATPIITYGNQTFTLNPLSVTQQDTILTIRGSDTDSLLTFVLSDTAKAIIQFGTVQELADSGLASYGNPFLVDLITPISTLGNVLDSGIVYANGKEYPFTVTSNVVYPSLLTIQDSLNFGNPLYLPTDEDLLLVNNGINPITILSTSGLSSPFSVYRGFASVASQDTQILLITFNPLTDDNFVDTLLITTADSIYSIILTGSSTGITEGVLASTVLSITDSTDGFTLNWNYLENATGFIVYQKASDVGSYTAFDTTSSLTTTFNYSNLDFREYLNYSFYVKAYNSNTTTNSNVETASSEITSSNVFYLNTTGDNTTGTSIATACTTITKLNSLVTLNSKVFIESDEQFIGDVYYPSQGSKTYTYGGTAKAIIGDTASTANDTTVVVLGTNTELHNLKLYGYSNAYRVLNFQADGLIVNGCEVVGGNNAHTNWTYGIEQSALSVVDLTIRNNEIRRFGGAGIYLRRCLNVDIGYNEIHDIWRTTSIINQGAMAVQSGVKTNGQTPEDTWDCNYTFNFHHNEVYDFEFVVSGAGFSRVIFEYNYIHDNLDERIYRGGVKHGTFGKLYDDTVDKLGGMGFIFRYNYIENIQRYGVDGYVYDVSTPTNRTNGTVPNVLATSHSFGTGPVYCGSGTTTGTSDFDVDYDHDGVWDFYGTPDKFISGLGYGRWWIHNNIFYRVENTIAGRSYSYQSYNSGDTWRLEFPCYFINNTILGCGDSYMARDNGLLKTSASSQSPFYVANNLINYANTSSRYAVRFAEKYQTLTNNIYTNQTGTKTAVNTSTIVNAPIGSKYAHGFEYNAVTSVGGLDASITIANEKYSGDIGTNKIWIDTTSTIFVKNIGVNGVYIPDLRITESSLAYNNGYPFASLGDNYTTTTPYWSMDVELGKDGSGRSFAYDILGNYRTTNDIGAVGLGLDAEQEISTVPVILAQPQDVSADSGSTVSFTVNVKEGDFVVGYQWWKYPYVSREESKILDGDSSKYEGATSRTLTIKNINDTDASTGYLVEVKNLNCYPADTCYINSNTAFLGITIPETVDTNYTIDSLTAYPLATRDDVYWYSSVSYNINDADLRLGNNGTNIYNVFWRFNGITIPSGALIDSAFIQIQSYATLSTNNCNAILYAEDNLNPADFDTPTELFARTLLTETITLNNIEAWTSGQYYKFYVTSLVNALADKYTYANDEMSFQARDNSSTSGAYRRMKSYDGASYVPRLKIYFRYIP